MINFFRKIKRSQLKDEKYVKYALYAIGEIILVVIGILIAVHLNDRKENQQNKKEETKLLGQFKSDLSKNKEEISYLIKGLNVNKKGIDSLITIVNSDNASFTIPIYVNFATRQIFFNKKSSGYNMTQNGMATYIENKTILSDILDLYENDFSGITQRQELMHAEIGYIRKEFINKLFQPSKYDMTLKLTDFDSTSNVLFEPIDFSELSSNTGFLNNLIQLKNTVDRRLAFLEETELKVDSTLYLIDQELL